MKQTNKSGYKILKITIPKTVFECEIPNSEDNEIEIDLNISTTHQITNNLLLFDLKLEINFILEKQIVGNALIVVRGRFEKFGDADLLFDDFVAVNAPAILFPYLREHLTNLSLKAGLNAVILEPVNFAALAKK